MTEIRGAATAYIFAAIALAAAAPAGAVVIDSVSVSNTYGQFQAYNQEPRMGSGGTQYQMTLPGTWYSANMAVTNRAELGINYVGRADDTGDFFFLHNNYCMGTCSTKSRTVIEFNLRNDGTSTEELRFDSLITPGHLARLGTGLGEAGFTFAVTQSGVTDPLYSASGTVSAGGIGVTTLDGSTFNGLRRVDVAGGSVLDWSGTNLNLLLQPLAAGQTTTIRYVAEYHSTSSDTCTDLRACGGFQVVFGDPRANGGGANVIGLSDLDGADQVGGEPTRDVVNQGYSRYASTFRFVNKNTALPDAPDVMPELTYGNRFTPQGSAPTVTAPVPEPATWGLMLAGLGATGGMLRRRRATVPARA